MKKPGKIPLNKQTSRAVGGLDIMYFSSGQISEPLSSHAHQAHRDEYYMVMINTKGHGKVQCDMEQIHVQSSGIVFIKPYQIHSVEQESIEVEGYALSVAPFLIPDHCLSVFQHKSISQQFVQLTEVQEHDILATANILLRAFNADSPYKTFIIHGLFNALINQIADLYAESNPEQKVKQNQSQVISKGFQKLLQEHSFLLPPSFFSEKLNITTSHLNDCVHAETGFSVTYWLQQAMVLEAKRNLYYTSGNVKEIAYHLGFDDHAYFSRLFKKVTGFTPLAFRKKFRG